jgi:hypothetical protein
MSIEIIKDEKYNEEIVFITNDDGTTTSMPKSVYDTLPSNSAPPDKPKK